MPDLEDLKEKLIRPRLKTMAQHLDLVLDQGAETQCRVKAFAAQKALDGEAGLAILDATVDGIAPPPRPHRGRPDATRHGRRCADLDR